MQNPIIKNGVFSGLAMVIYTLVIYLVDPSLLSNMKLAFIPMIIVIIFMVRAVSDFKAQNNGFASFGEALLQSLGTAVIATVISNIFVYILYNFIDPGMLEVLKQASIDQMESMEGLLGEEGVDRAVDELESQEFTFGIGKVLIGTLTSIFIYLIISLIVAAITQKKPKGAASLDSHV